MSKKSFSEVKRTMLPEPKSRAAIEAENARLQERIDETERLKAELNRILHPKGDGPAAPAWCDLIAFVEGDLARLQAALTEAERVGDGLHAAVLMGSRHTEAIERERDGYKALAERRGEMLTDSATAIHSDRRHEGRFWDCDLWGCSGARAALAPRETE
jgi:hypothetical protein